MKRAGTSIAAPPSAVADGDVAIDVRSVSRRFGDVQALRDVSMRVTRGEVHALLGPNGAGKTTLLRILSGLVSPETGETHVLGVPWNDPPREAKHLFGLVPSGDRTFYLRLSGLENLSFFGRLYGLGRSQARDRALQTMREVGLEDVALRRVMTYSHGMQKRLSVARGLLMDPPLLFVDEATHDLDPDGARRIRELVAVAAERGAGVVWATQRIEEIRGFANSVTLLHRGAVRFQGTLTDLLSYATPDRFILQLRTGDPDRDPRHVARGVLEGAATVTDEGGTGDHVLVELDDGVTLGHAIGLLARNGVDVLACREPGSTLEQAFLTMTEDEGR